MLKANLCAIALAFTFIAPLSAQSSGAASPSTSSPATTAPAPPASPPKMIRISSAVAQGYLLKKINPTYPPADAQGLVILKVIIDIDGNVISVSEISGPAPLISTAIDAVKRWKYRPYILNGQPVAVTTQVTVMFSR